MRVLLTGGRGFIGTNLADELADNGHDVRVTDIEDGDLRDHWIARQHMLRHDPDVVVHLAAQVGRLRGEDNWRHTIESNAVMTSYVAAAAHNHGVPRFVYTSTSEVYGDHHNVVCHEDDGPWALPHNLYGLSKRWGEEAARLYFPSSAGLQVIRPSMPYGPGAPPGRGRRAMDNMLHQALWQQPITVHCGAERSWCWIGDVVRAWRLVIEDGTPGAYNVGRDDDERTMLEIARMACTMADAPLGLINEVEAPAKQTVVKRLSTQKIRDLGWRPEVELEEGIVEVFDWIKLFDWQGNGPTGIDYDSRVKLLEAR